MAQHNGTKAGLTFNQIHQLLVVERTMSIISMIATIFVIAMFLLITELKRKTFNRLLFLASWGNLLTNVATLIGRAGVQAGQRSATCKVQATLIQWFMPADSLWMACMAVNVFLTFQTTTVQVNLHKLEKWYFIFCFGVPGIPAVTYLLLDLTKGTDYYGDATLWCWIATNHDSLRIITFYGPVWVILLLTMTLYAVTGRSIYKGQVRNSTIRDQIRDTPSPEDRYAMYIPDDTPINQLANLPKKTAISEITERTNKENRASSTSSYTLTVAMSPETHLAEDNRVSTFTHISDSRQSQPPVAPGHTPIQIPGFGDGTKVPNQPYPIPAMPTQDSGLYPSIADRSRPKSPLHDPITPIESTEQLPLPISRSGVRSCEEDDSDSSSDSSSEAPVQNPPDIFVALNVQQTSNESTSGRRSRFGSFSKSWTPRLSSLTSQSSSKTNRGARTYARVAFLLYLTILIVWVPSTVNRIYGLATANRKGSVNFGLNFAAALVLPTQGLFNAFVFCFTSRNELAKRIVDAYHGKWKSDINEIREINNDEELQEEPRSKSVMEV